MLETLKTLCALSFSLGPHALWFVPFWMRGYVMRHTKFVILSVMSALVMLLRG